MLAVTRLTLTDFRCYPHLRLDCERRPVVLTGPNGAGKTNILEALSFLAPGRGLRRAKIGEVSRIGAAAPPWAVAAKVEGDGEAEAAEIGTGRDGTSERRLVRIDGRAARGQSGLTEVVSVLWLTPAMDRLFSDGAAGRRRFLDRLVLGQDPAHARRSSAYEHALKERARLLREPRHDGDWVGVLEERMAREGIAIMAARRAAVDRLNRACRQRLGPFPAASLGLDGPTEAGLAGREGAEAEDWLRQALSGARRKDGESGVTALGPHRSDLAVRHADKDVPAERCSTGEQKAVLVSVILAQARIQSGAGGLPPILLLDEIAAHLDEIRRAALFDELEAMAAQSWLTGTDESLFAPLGGRGQFFRVKDAGVEPAKRS